MEEITQQVQQLIEDTSDVIQAKLTDIAVAVHENVDGETVLEAVLEVGSFVVEAITD